MCRSVTANMIGIRVVYHETNEGVRRYIILRLGDQLLSHQNNRSAEVFVHGCLRFLGLLFY